MSDNGLIPQGWAKATVGSLVILTNGFAFKPAQWKPEGTPIIRIQNLNNPEAGYNYCAESLPNKYRVVDGDLLFAWSGTPGTSFGAHIWRGPKAWLNQHIFKVDFDERNIDKQFLRLALNVNLDEYIRAAHGGAGLAHITKRVFEASEVLIPPLDEQRRIVAKLDELLSDLDAGVAALERARANLKRYRAAVLKAAVEGRLTEQWRAEHPATEPASQLLERILAERRRKWEADQLAKYAAAGKTPPKNWQAKYVEPTPPEITELPELPRGWCWASVEQLTIRSEYGTSVKCDYTANGFPVIRIPNIAAGMIDLEDLKFATQPLDLTDEDALQPGDLLMCRTNGSVSLIGKAAVVRAAFSQRHTFASYLLRFRFVDPKLLPLWIHLYASSTLGRRFIEGNAASSAGQHNISLSLMHRMPVPLPSAAEQQEIISDVEERLSVIAVAERQIEENSHRAARLRQSILKRAFEGKLVPQDPTDEPASVLLERIRQQRTSTADGERSKMNTRRKGTDAGTSRN
jgi:type I restriction enzyme S subunit